MRAIGYIRVSTEDQAKEGISLDAQEAKIRSWAELNNAHETFIFRDEGLSGKRSDNRQGLQSAIDSVGNGDALIVYSLSRLSRSTKDTLVLSEMLLKKEADLVSLSEKIDTTTAAGKMVFRLLAVLNEFERDQISDRTRFALAHKKIKREWVGRIPFGYRVEDNHLIEDAEAMKRIKQAKRMKTEGKSYREISRALNLSVGYVHKVINTDMRKIKTGYSKRYGSASVH
jgi:DNA invertase Pin-like site-specific DNA recombinase